MVPPLGGDRPGRLLRLGSGLSGTGFMALLVARLALTEGWLWWAAFVLGLTTVVVVAGYFYGPEDRLDPEGGTPAGRGPGN